MTKPGSAKKPTESYLTPQDAEAVSELVKFSEGLLKSMQLADEQWYLSEEERGALAIELKRHKSGGRIGWFENCDVFFSALTDVLRDAKLKRRSQSYVIRELSRHSSWRGERLNIKQSAAVSKKNTLRNWLARCPQTRGKRWHEVLQLIPKKNASIMHF